MAESKEKLFNFGQSTARSKQKFCQIKLPNFWLTLFTLCFTFVFVFAKPDHDSNERPKYENRLPDNYHTPSQNNRPTQEIDDFFDWPEEAYLRNPISPMIYSPLFEHTLRARPSSTYVPKYMIEAPQRSSSRNRNLGELFVALGPLVVLPLLSSLALSSFTTMFVSKALGPKSSRDVSEYSLDQSNISGLHYDLWRPNNTIESVHSPNARIKRHTLVAKELGFTPSSFHTFIPSSRPAMRRRSAPEVRKKHVIIKKKTIKSTDMGGTMRLNYIAPYPPPTLAPSVNQTLFDQNAAMRFAFRDGLLLSTPSASRHSDNKKSTFFSLLTNHELHSSNPSQQMLNPFQTPNFHLTSQAMNDASSIKSNKRQSTKLPFLTRPLQAEEPETETPSSPVYRPEKEKTQETAKMVKSSKHLNRSSRVEPFVHYELGSDLDVVQKYLRQTRPDGEYNDEIIATYLSCNGLLDTRNRCLQRLVCQYADPLANMGELEKEVASLIIYAILKNKYIEDGFKLSMRSAAQFALTKPGQCANKYSCLKAKNARGKADSDY